ncbi:potassium channel subfamily K member 4-like [Hypanus sabinus]|uniref:potassium channel subfamily K member 4-like n=1 Tax=Hypanus sabinus TaxID=79690 RepID=UPI0028C4AE4B|nr:potassium channel subfamily K member 4-like [Hypanus sabinus]
MQRRTVLAILLVVLTYLVVGAALFRLLEQPFEREQWARAAGAREMFLREHRCVDAAQLDLLLEQVLMSLDAGIDPIANSTDLTSNWDLSSAFFFAGTVITTIGFGNISPKTDEGRMLCIVYALVGIPMFGSLLAGVGDQLGSALGQLIGKVEEIFLKWEVSPTAIRVLSTLLFILIGCLLFVSTPVLIFQWVEGWTTLESVYFVVVTLTTIGFGDYVAGGDARRGYKAWYKPLVWFWIVLGLAYFAAILSMIGDWLRVLSRRTREEVSGFTAHAAHWTANIATDIKTSHWDRLPPREVPLGQEAVPESEGAGARSPSSPSRADSPRPDCSQPIDFLAENLLFIDTEDSERSPSPLAWARGRMRTGNSPHPARSRPLLEPSLRAKDGGESG